MLSRATASVARPAASVFAALGSVVHRIPATPTVASSERSYTTGKWATENRHKLDAARRSEVSAKVAESKDRRMKDRARAISAAANPSPASFHAANIAELQTTSDEAKARLAFGAILSGAQAQPLMMREYTQVFQAARKYPFLFAPCMRLFETALRSENVFLESRMFQAIKEVCEAAGRPAAWSLIHAAHMRLYPPAQVDWLGNKTMTEPVECAPLPLAEDIAKMRSTPDDYLKMVATKRSMNRQLLPRTHVAYVLSLFAKQRPEDAVKELFAYWKIVNFGDGSAPGPFDPVRCVLVPKWQHTRADLFMPLKSAIIIANCLERAGMYSAALTHLNYTRTYLRYLDHAPVREVTPRGVKRDYLDLSHLSDKVISDTIALLLVEARLRLAMGAAIAKSGEAPMTFLPGSESFRYESAFLTTEPEDLVVITDRHMILKNVREGNWIPVTKSLHEGSRVYGVKSIDARALSASPLSSSALPEVDRLAELVAQIRTPVLIAEDADAETKAAAQAARKREYAEISSKLTKVIRPEMSVVITKEEIVRLCKESSQAIATIDVTNADNYHL